ncbi:MAG: hypothetical protein U1C55_05430 [Smithellaceae bacterium]|nr:hypothetical protein [Smithellaceae bacterium]
MDKEKLYGDLKEAMISPDEEEVLAQTRAALEMDLPHGFPEKKQSPLPGSSMPSMKDCSKIPRLVCATKRFMI